ncbi:hypothetical protein BDC45DRAFT_511888 [Circinella umbellata]|nr:hypothetical protein BDC45DRAFT_511888 [Circinella umbellata]
MYHGSQLLGNNIKMDNLEKLFFSPSIVTGQIIMMTTIYIDEENNLVPSSYWHRFFCNNFPFLRE